MTDVTDTRIVKEDCTAWSTKANGKPDGGADSKPIAVRKGTVVTVQGVNIDVEPRSLLVRATVDGVERGLEIRERFLEKRNA